MRLSARRPAPAPLPWRRPRHELLLLTLVAAAALSVVLPAGAEDTSRMCLTRALVHGRISADRCLEGTSDRSSYGNHLYTNTAPGLSALAVPAAAAVRLPSPPGWIASGDLRLWAVRLSTSGLGLIVCAFLVGRLAEGLAPGWGGATLVTFALGTIALAAGPTSFGHLPAAALALGAFALVWGKRPLWGGLVAGLSVLVEYQSGLIVALVGIYALLSGARAAARYALALIPGFVLLGGYDWAAFGSPFHLSYRYNAAQSQAGLFGIGLPSLHGLHLVMIGDRGLLPVSPVLVAAAVGLVLLGRRGFPVEATVALIVTLAFVILDAGYFLPYGGDSPGPRFVIPALPFLALGLAPAFAARRAPTAALAIMSVIASAAIALTWPAAVNSATGYRWTVWRQLASFAGHGSSSQIAGWAQKNVLSWAGLGRLGAAAAVFACAFAALGVALRNGWARREEIEAR